MEYKTREGRIRIMRKKILGYVQAMVNKKRLLINFQDGQKKNMSSYSLVFLKNNKVKFDYL